MNITVALFMFCALAASAYGQIIYNRILGSGGGSRGHSNFGYGHRDYGHPYGQKYLDYLRYGRGRGYNSHDRGYGREYDRGYGRDYGRGYDRDYDDYGRGAHGRRLGDERRYLSYRPGFGYDLVGYRYSDLGGRYGQYGRRH